MVARSWGARLDFGSLAREDGVADRREGQRTRAPNPTVEPVDQVPDDGWRARATALIEVAALSGPVRALTDEDMPAVLALDAATLGDYPGGVATAHRRFDDRTARPERSRTAWGVVDEAGRVLAATYVDLAGDRAEIDVTVVAGHCRGRGLGTGVKAASLLDLADRGAQVVRTGGPTLNTSIMAANRRLGFVVDEQWVTLTSPSADG